MHWGGIIARQRGDVKDFFRIGHLVVKGILPTIGMEMDATVLSTYLEEMEAENTQTMATYRERVTQAGLPLRPCTPEPSLSLSL